VSLFFGGFKYRALLPFQCMPLRQGNDPRTHECDELPHVCSGKRVLDVAALFSRKLAAQPGAAAEDHEYEDERDR